MPEEHAKLSPSAAKRWMNCPGSVRLSECIEAPSSDYAKEGTAAHFVAEQCLKHRCNADELWSVLSRKNGQILETEQFVQYKKWINGEMFEYVQGYLDMIHRDMNAVPAGLRLFNVEQRFDLNWLVEDLWGTNDVCLGEYLKTLTVYDLKYGAGVPVEVVDNPQLMIYALGAVGEYNNDEYETVSMVIYQPRCYHEDGPMRRWDMSVSDLFAWAYNVLKPAAKATQDPKAPLHAGDWCLFCPVMGACPELAKDALETARADFSQNPATIDLPEPELLSDREIARVLQFSDIISAWAKQVAGHAQAVLEGGGKIDGYKLVPKRANRKWINTATAEVELHSLLGRQIYTQPKLKGPAQIEKLLGKNKSAIKHLWEKPDTGVTIAPQSDRREAVPPPAIMDFL
jgi:hypothetical protein